MARRVLLVEDDDDVRAQLADAVRGAGYEVVALADAREATEHLDTAAAPDLIVLDLLMPFMNGWEFLHWLGKREVLSRVPVLLISGSPHAEEARVLHVAVAGLLAKPFTLDAFVAELRRFLPA